MRTVWKYLADGTTFQYMMPTGAVVLHVDIDPAGMCAIWVEVDSDAMRVLRRFRVTGTGHEVPPACVYVGSVTNMPFVWHVWEVMA